MREVQKVILIIGWLLFNNLLFQSRKQKRDAKMAPPFPSTHLMKNLH